MHANSIERAFRFRDKAERPAFYYVLSVRLFVRLSVCLSQSHCDVNLNIYLRSCILNKPLYDGRPPLYHSSSTSVTLRRHFNIIIVIIVIAFSTLAAAAAAAGDDKLHNSRLPMTVGNCNASNALLLQCGNADCESISRVI